jgi:hypothetical protein
MEVAANFPLPQREEEVDARSFPFLNVYASAPRRRYTGVCGFTFGTKHALFSLVRQAIIATQPSSAIVRLIIP